MGISKKREQEYAQLLYTQERLSFKEISERINVSPKTISKWCNDNGWDKIRKSLLITKQNQITKLYDQLEWINNQIAERNIKVADTKEADIISKISNAIKKMETDTSIGDIIEVGRSFIEFVKNVDFTKAKDITLLYDQFINSKL